MINLQQIQNKLVNAIKESKLTLTEIAKKIGVKPQQITCYLYGDKMPSLRTLANLCKLLNLDANYILCLTD